MNASKFRHICIFSVLFSGCQVTFAQAPIQPTNKPLSTSVSLETGFSRFKGDNSISRFGNGNVQMGVAFNLQYTSWRATMFASKSKISWNDQLGLSRNNFECTNINAGIMAGRFLFNTIEGKRFNPFAMMGVAGIRANTFSDLQDNNGNTYYYWSDGSIRNVAESNENQTTGLLLKRDYTYETALAGGQKSLCFPIELGISASISPRLSMEVSWRDLLLQSDNFDVNTDNPKWDNIQQINVKLTCSLVKKLHQAKPTQLKEEINYQGIDLNALMNEDEDSDGIVDAKDRCFGTPKGAIIDQTGCSLDSDLDGIPDYSDKEINTPAGSWVDENGVAHTDNWLKEHYRDSSSYFVQVLRKINRNSRPFPVKKYIPKENNLRWLSLLEEHPDWRVKSEVIGDKFPSELHTIDSNNDHYISLKELQEAVNQLFEGSKSMNEALLNKAMNYAFQEQ